MENKPSPFNEMIRIKKHILFIFLTVSFLNAIAQTEVIDFGDTTVINRNESPQNTPAIMDVGWNKIPTKFFTMNIGLALLLDHNILVQDDQNIAQVGKVDPGTEFRGDRLILSGTIKGIKGLPIKYNISANYNGLEGSKDKPAFEMIDWNFEFPFKGKAGWLTVGKQKENVGHEYIAPGTQLSFMERGSGAPAFIRQRNIGIRYGNNAFNQRLAFTLGFFNNYWSTGKSFSDNGSQITMRASGLAQYESDRELMHVAIAYRHTGATDGQLSYKAKPEANTAPNFLQTGSFDASSAGTLLLEYIGVRGPFTLFGEYMLTNVNSEASGDPTFSYWQLGGSWFVTGENRKYNKHTGNLGKLLPIRNVNFKEDSGWGALELAARYTYTDMTDALITGGTFGRFTSSASWYLNPFLRLSATYGIGRLDDSERIGKTTFWQFRIQFEL